MTRIGRSATSCTDTRQCVPGTLQQLVLACIDTLCGSLDQLQDSRSIRLPRGLAAHAEGLADRCPGRTATLGVGDEPATFDFEGSDLALDGSQAIKLRSCGSSCHAVRLS